MSINKKIFTLGLALLGFSALKAQQRHLLVGTYTNGGNSEGIYTFGYNPSGATQKPLHIAKGIDNPSYICFSPDKKFVYAVSENGDKSAVSAFAYNKGKLTFINKQNSAGADPCYITTDGKHVIVANYSGGNIAVLSINADGSLNKAKQTIQHTGKGIDPKGRQQSAHVHMTYFSPDRKYVLSTDLGEDKIYVYSYHAKAGTPLKLKNVYQVKPASGPRHLTFSPNGKFVYLANEFTGMITAFAYNKGQLKKIQDVATVAKDFKGAIDAADIHTSPDGRFLYETNRGDANSINVFAIAPNGHLKFVQTVPTLGKGPRNFTISPDGNQLLVAHQYTNNVVIFNRDKVSGKLTDTGKSIAVGTPVCLLFE